MKIEIKIESLMPDRTNYKQYSTKYTPENLYVRLDVPDAEVLDNIDEIVLTERGLQILIGKLADIADDVEIAHLHSQLPK